MAKKDVATLEAVLADDLIYTHSSARLDTKRSLIDAMVVGGDRLYRCRTVGREGAGSR